MPQMGTSMTEGTVVAWMKAVGDRVEADEAICEISTDKVDTECPSPASGTVSEILVEVETTVEVGTVLARISVAADADTPVAGQAAASGSARPAPPNGGRRYSPVVRRIAADNAVDLTQVPATGRGGRVTKKDLLAWLASRDNAAASEPPLHSDSPYRADAAPDLGGEAAPLSRIRRSIGTAMLRSQQVAATCHTVVECDFSSIEGQRRKLEITALPLVARSVVGVLRRFPDLNATLDGETVTRFGDRVHIGIAVSLGNEGLIVPVIHDAQELSTEGLAIRIKDLARKARSKELDPDDVVGASFTITSPGAYGATIATPVINQPQVGILDLEAIVKRVVVVNDDAGADSIAIRPMANLVLGWDHRAIDGVYAAEFLSAVRESIEA